MPSYSVLLSDKASAYLHLDVESAAAQLPIYVEQRTFEAGAERLDEEFALVLSEALDELRDEVERKSGHKQVGSLFEARGAASVHYFLTEVPSRVKADPDFWTWLTIAHFSELVEWRFGAENERANQVNYGVRSPKEGMIYRMWYRGDIGYDPTLSDPYELSRTGDQDLWRSHIIRQNYGNVRSVARSLLRLQSGKLEQPKLGVAEVRELAKRIKRLRANVMLELLTPEEADALILDLSTGL